MGYEFGPRRGVYVDILEEMKKGAGTLTKDEVSHFESFDLIYRSLCAILYNYVPMSGHPGGSISSGRFVEGVIFDAMDYDLSNPDREDADMLSYAAGHKALGLYAMWALRNEIARVGAPGLLPNDTKYQLRLEDLLGFRRNPITDTPLFKKFHSKALDGHPTPSTPFLKLSTGASGVGVAASIGLAFAATDRYGSKQPYVHIVEGEGGMTPGRVAEAFAGAGTSSLKNVVIHIDWNQASIDSNHVCRDGKVPGDYVQWTPMEFAYIHDWNVIYVEDGKNFEQVIAAQRKAANIGNNQPTAIVYRTIKGWQYGIEGKSSHGAGHKLCADGFYAALEPLMKVTNGTLPKCDPSNQRCQVGKKKDIDEACFWESLLFIRKAIEQDKAMTGALAKRLTLAKDRLDKNARSPRQGAPNVNAIYEIAKNSATNIPKELLLEAGASVTLRGELGKVLNYYNKASGGSMFVAAADLLGSTSVNEIYKGFPEGYFNAATNPMSRQLSIGGICEDAIAGILAGISTFGHNIGVGSSYGAFLAPLGHIAARLHAIGNQARREFSGDLYKPFILICAHAGLKTGEDGPTHADPQALQLFQENFPDATMITLTPWDPQEIWTLVSAALAKRPAIIAPFVTRPNEKILDRKALGLCPVADAVTGMYLLRKAKGKRDGVLVLQESAVTNTFLTETLPLLEKEGIDLDVYYVASAELFDLLPRSERDRIFPESSAKEAMGITGFTFSTIYRWVTSELGRKHTLHPFQKGHYLGSGQGELVIAQAGLDGESQFKAIVKYVRERKEGK